MSNSWSTATKAMHTAGDGDSDTWCTPEIVAHALGHFSCDPCSNSRSRIRSEVRYSLEDDQDGLARSWGYSVFVNGPYSDPLPWCRRLAKHAGPAVALWKLDPTTRWFFVLVEAGFTWRAFRSRLRFERPDKPPITANFPSVLMFRGWTPSPALAALLWTQ